MRVFKQHLEFVGVVHFHGHVGAEKFGLVVDFYPTCLVGEQRVGGGVGFVKAVACEFFHQVEDFVGFGFADAVFGCTFAKQQAVLCHFFGLFLAHGAA